LISHFRLILLRVHIKAHICRADIGHIDRIIPVRITMRSPARPAREQVSTMSEAIHSLGRMEREDVRMRRVIKEATALNILRGHVPTGQQAQPMN
jgi:hypothetical protein